MKHEKGFSLAEVLIACTIMLIVMGAVVQTLTDGLHATQAVTLMADTQENLRGGMNYIVRDLSMAGEGIPQGGVPITAGTVVWPGTAGKFPATWTTIPAIAPGPNLGATTTTSGNPTDTITLLYADTTLVDNTKVPPAWLSEYPINDTAVCPAGSVTTSGTSPNLTATLTFDSNACININQGNTGIHVGDLLLLQGDGTTCNQQSSQLMSFACDATSPSSGNILRTVTGVNGSVVTLAPGDAFGLNGGSLPTGDITATRIWMITYYVSNANPSAPQLMRQVNLNTANEVAEVIENMQFYYDILNPGASPPGLVAPTEQENPAYANLPYIRDVYVQLYARSENTFTVSNQYIRNNLVTTVSTRGMDFYNEF